MLLEPEEHLLVAFHLDVEGRDGVQDRVVVYLPYNRQVVDRGGSQFDHRTTLPLSICLLCSIFYFPSSQTPRDPWKLNWKIIPAMLSAIQARITTGFVSRRLSTSMNGSRKRSVGMIPVPKK